MDASELAAGAQSPHNHVEVSAPLQGDVVDPSGKEGAEERTEQRHLAHEEGESADEFQVALRQCLRVRSVRLSSHMTLVTLTGMLGYEYGRMRTVRPLFEQGSPAHFEDLLRPLEFRDRRGGDDDIFMLREGAGLLKHHITPPKMILRTALGLRTQAFGT